MPRSPRCGNPIEIALVGIFWLLLAISIPCLAYGQSPDRTWVTGTWLGEKVPSITPNTWDKWTLWSCPGFVESERLSGWSLYHP
jgi:hypothetical protein